MSEMATISAILSSIKTATEIAKLIRSSDLTLEQAEVKLKLAELISALADAKIELAEVQETLSAKEKKIAELDEAFQTKDTLVRGGDAYYTADEKGAPKGVPFCLRCWENDHKKRQLVLSSANGREMVCHTCSHGYNDWMARKL